MSDKEYVTYKTPVFRVHYPNVFTPRAQKEGQAAKYSVMAIWTPADFSAVDKKRWKELKAAMNAASEKRFGKVMKDLPRTFKLGLRDGAEKEDIEACGPGTIFANLTTKNAPGIIGPDGLKLSLEEGNDDEFYAGCYARATVNIYTYDNEGKGLALGLNNLMKVKDGEVIEIGAQRNARDDFADDVGDVDADDDEDSGFLD